MAAAVQHVGANQATEQQALAAQEQPHCQLVVAEPGGGDVGAAVLVVVCGRNRSSVGFVDSDVSQLMPTPS